MKKCLIIILFCVIVLSTIFSIFKFGVINPISSCFGMFKILFTDTEYTMVQNTPKKVFFSKTLDTSNKSGMQYLNDYMENRGFKLLEGEQMGSILVYSNGEEKEYIVFSTNKYFSKWKWQR